MRLILLTTLVMIAFAANSVLNRMALVGDATGPAAFALIRLGAGALFLLGLASLRGGGIPWRAPLRLCGDVFSRPDFYAARFLSSGLSAEIFDKSRMRSSRVNFHSKGSAMLS